jgi:hypothetical protein
MIDKLFQSFCALYQVLERPKAAGLVVFGLVAIHTGLIAYSAYVHSPTLNEPAHLVAGISYWKTGRFELYSVNPPLVKIVAAAPTVMLGAKENWSRLRIGDGARSESLLGRDFVAVNGQRTFFLIMISRWVCIPFSWIGAVTCFLWARDLYGRPAGVMACSLWCFEPNILAHASLITPDIGGTSLGVAACYTFWRWLKKPTWGQAALTGIVLGLAELCKTTLILFYPLWPVLWVIYRLLEQREKSAVHSRKEVSAVKAPCDWFREAGMLALRMVIGLYVLNLGYGFEGSGTRLKDFHFVSNLLTGQAAQVLRQEPANSQSNLSPSANRQSGAQTINRFANSWLGAIPVPFPKNYVLGMDIQQKDFEYYGRPSFLRGEWQDHGWWYYYLYAALIKMPIGLWALGLVAVWLRLFSSQGAIHCAVTQGQRDTLILLVPPLVIFCVASAKSGFSEHFRYVLPCFPFIFIWISRLCAEGFIYTQQPDIRYIDCVHSPKSLAMRSRKLYSIILAFYFMWFVNSSIWIYPHSLSYFNETVGGPLNGSKYLLGSNVDWGQDLRYLKWWLADNEDKVIGTILYSAYFGYFDPGHMGIPASGSVLRSTSNSDGNTRDKIQGTAIKNRFADSIDTRATVYIVSLNLLNGYEWMFPSDNMRRLMLNGIRAIVNVPGGKPKPIGYSFLVFVSRETSN